MSTHVSRFLLLLLGLLTAAAPARGQAGAIQGQVTDAETGEALASASVEVVAGGRTVQRAITGPEGRYRVAGLEPGGYAVVFRLLGYETSRIDGVRVAAGETATVSPTLRSDAFRLNPVVVTASKRQEKALEAPASITIVDAKDIAEQPAVTAVDHVRALPGVDIASTGLMQSNVVARGFNNVFSGSLLMLTDNRLAHVPSLRVNASYLIPTTNQDIERIEVVLGPGAALYGPNSAGGVMHIITRSPFDVQETSLSVAGGARAESAPVASVPGLGVPEDDTGLFHVAGRHSAMINDQWAYKVSGQFFRGGDWLFIDPAEDTERRALIDRGADPDTLLVGRRDYTAERWAGEARVDWRPDDRTEAIFSVGATTAVSAIEMTGLGAAQGKDWRYSYYQARLRRDRLFGQVFLNTSDAGDTYLLRTGQPIIDRSRMLVAQVQHGFDLGERQGFIYGVDFLRTEPRTEGTITGRNEDDDNITELGGYLHSETRLGDRFDIVAALRADYHSHLDDLVLSPRAALVFRPIEAQNFRLTYNRGFSTPTTNNLFLDLKAATLAGGLYEVRALGVPSGGLSFRRDCGGAFDGLCMRSPFSEPLGLPQFAPIDAARLWPAVVQLARGAVLQATGVDLARIPAPTGAQVASVLRRLDPTAGAFVEIGAEDVVDIATIQPTITNTFEAGYKGLIGNRLMLAADAWYERRNDFVGPLIVESPSVFLEQGSLARYLAQFVPNPLVAAAIATSLSGISGNPNFPGVPLGTVLPSDPRIADNAMILTYRNFGEVDLWGADFAAQLLIGSRFSVSGTYSFVSDDYFDKEEVGGGSDVALNAPQHKGSIGADFRDEARGLNAEARARFTAGFPMNSGVYIGDVEGYTLVDVTAGWRLPFLRRTSATVTVQNLLNDMHREFIGAPQIGRLVLARLQYTF